MIIDTVIKENGNTHALVQSLLNPSKTSFVLKHLMNGIMYPIEFKYWINLNDKVRVECDIFSSQNQTLS